MTCRDVLDFLMDYLDGKLTPPQRALFEEHLAFCQPCVAYLHTYRHTIQLAKSCVDNSLATDVPDDLVEAILAARKA